MTKTGKLANGEAWDSEAGYGGQSELLAKVREIIVA